MFEIIHNIDESVETSIVALKFDYNVYFSLIYVSLLNMVIFHFMVSFLKKILFHFSIHVIDASRSYSLIMPVQRMASAKYVQNENYKN